MKAFARQVYVVERGKKAVMAMRAQEAQEKRRQLAQQTSLTASAQVPRSYDDATGCGVGSNQLVYGVAVKVV